MRTLSLLIALFVTTCLHADEPASVEQRLDTIEQQLAIQTQCPPKPASKCVVDVDLIPTQLRLTGSYGDDNGFAGRLSACYEGENGFGIRGQWWGFDGNDLSLNETANLVDLDLYQSFAISATRFAIGAGPRYATFALETPFGEGRFSGEGASAFAEMRHPTPVGQCGELAVIGRTRVSLVAGDWNSINNTFIRATNGDTISILELSLGVEYRRRIGSDASWFVQVAPEIQRWDSGFIADRFNLGSDIGFLGVGLDMGLTW